MATKEIPYAYRRDIPFDLELDETGDLKMIEDIDAINQSIYTLLTSNSGDKPLEPLFGSNVEDLIFTPGLPINIIELEIEERLKTSAKNSEPELIIFGVQVDFSNVGENTIRVKVFYALNDGITTGVFDESLSVEDLKR